MAPTRILPSRGFFFRYCHPDIAENRRVRCELSRTPVSTKPPTHTLIGSVNTSAFTAIYPRKCYATTNFLDPDLDFWSLRQRVT
jgi:hypothetical protein